MIDAEVLAAHMATLPAASEEGEEARQPRLTGQLRQPKKQVFLYPARQTIAAGRKISLHRLAITTSSSRTDGDLLPCIPRNDGFVWGLQQLTDKYFRS